MLLLYNKLTVFSQAAITADSSVSHVGHSSGLAVNVIPPHVLETASTTASHEVSVLPLLQRVLIAVE